MTGFVLTRKAKADLLEIARYSEVRWGSTQRN
jgi:plasmid stabilization system protein ParE